MNAQGMEHVHTDRQVGEKVHAATRRTFVGQFFATDEQENYKDGLLGQAKGVEELRSWFFIGE